MKTELRNFLMGAGVTVLLWAPFLKAEDSKPEPRLSYSDRYTGDMLHKESGGANVAVAYVPAEGR
jgi:hypothetical protein